MTTMLIWLFSLPCNAERTRQCCRRAWVSSTVRKSMAAGGARGHGGAGEPLRLTGLKAPKGCGDRGKAECSQSYIFLHILESRRNSATRIMMGRSTGG